MASECATFGNTDVGSAAGNGNPSQCHAEIRMNQGITDIKQDRRMGASKIHALDVRKMPNDELTMSNVVVQYRKTDRPLLESRG
jgi:hypothetical protein